VRFAVGTAFLLVVYHVDEPMRRKVQALVTLGQRGET